ncbi:MAG: VWA domain-containing protein [Synechococcales cyanobacterium]
MTDLLLPEFVDNSEKRCPVILLLDTSGSMSGAPIAALNEGLKQFREDILKDEVAQLRVEVAIITFGPVKLHQDFCTVDQLDQTTLRAQADTPMGRAIEFAIEKLEQRKQLYRANGIEYYRPWIFLITDGSPTDAWQESALKVRKGEEERKHLFFAVAVQGANLEVLSQIAPENRPPVRLAGLQFIELFRWLSSSMGRGSRQKANDPIALPPVGWGEIS